jgi:hypothetical protein
VKLETKVDGLDDMAAFGLKVATQMAHKFDGGDYYTSMDMGESFRYSVCEYKMEGDRVVILNPGGPTEASEMKDTVMSYPNGVFMAITRIGGSDQIIIIYKKA